MSLRDRRVVAATRTLTFVAMVGGVVLTAAGPATVTGLLPYFTIQSNIAFGLFAGWAAGQAWRNGDVQVRPAVKGALTLYVTITGLVYHLVLTNPASGFAVGDVQRSVPEAIGNQLLHTVVPLLAVLDFLLFDERRRYRWRYAAYWLVFPLGYQVFVVLRGLVVGRYPYPFNDVAAIGYDGLAVATVVFGLAFWVLGLALVLADRHPLGLARPAGVVVPE
jgi:hypothetical protein